MPFFYVRRFENGIADDENKGVEAATATNAAELVAGVPVAETVKLTPIYYQVTAATKPNEKMGFCPVAP